MQLTQVNGFYLATNSRAGGYSGSPTIEQISNANIIRSFFLDKGWSINAICGMLGCMQGESTINPAFIQATHRSRLPNSADDLTDVPNSVAKNFYDAYYGEDHRGYGMGLVQWDGYTWITRNPPYAEQKMVAFAIANNIIWYDGWTQMYRIYEEQQLDTINHETKFFNTVRVSGTEYNFWNYPTATDTPENLAKAFTWGYERNKGGEGFRPENARRWYDLFTGQFAPPVVPPEDFLLPLEADPLEPPFDPDNPVEPSPDASEEFPIWMLGIVNRKGGLDKKCRKI